MVAFSDIDTSLGTEERFNPEKLAQALNAAIEREGGAQGLLQNSFPKRDVETTQGAAKEAMQILLATGQIDVMTASNAWSRAFISEARTPAKTPDETLKAVLDEAQQAGIAVPQDLPDAQAVEEYIKGAIEDSLPTDELIAAGIITELPNPLEVDDYLGTDLANDLPQGDGLSTQLEEPISIELDRAREIQDRFMRTLS